ncbi:MAG: hypothetical protein WD315_06260 [Balneolaceae bacterium]
MVITLLLTLLVQVQVSCTDGDPVPVLLEQESFRSDAIEAIDYLYNRQVDRAEEQMGRWRESCPDHPVWALWKGMELWWDLLEDLHDDSKDEQFLRWMERADAAAVELLEQNPEHTDAQIVRAVANGFAARHHANRNRWVKSIRTASHAMNAHEELGRLAPDLTDNLFAEGMKLYYSAWLPDAYPVLKPFRWLLPDGDREEGLRLLEEASRTAVFSQPESLYFLGVILLRYEDRPSEATGRFQELVGRYPDNSYYRRMLVRSLFSQGMDRQVVQVVDQSLDHWRRLARSDERVLQEELLFWKGRSLLRMGLPAQAIRALEESWKIGRELPNREERPIQVLSGYYAGRASEQTGDIGSAREWYERILDLESEPDIRSEASDRLERLTPGS